MPLHDPSGIDVNPRDYNIALWQTLITPSAGGSQRIKENEDNRIVKPSGVVLEFQRKGADTDVLSRKSIRVVSLAPCVFLICGENRADSDDEILPFNSWVPIRKSNFVLDLQKKQRNPIFQISMDIMQNTNFFRAFTASASVPAIYLDKDWFILDANLLREALEITPIDQAHQFVSPPSGDAIIDFVNELGYPGAVHFVSRMVVNHLYQPWRAILSMINQCLTGKTSGFSRLRYLVLQMLWGNTARTNVDYAELI
ncbi:hypothetical protein Tco_0105123 [Tanacetum coccineum]